MNRVYLEGFSHWEKREDFDYSSVVKNFEIDEQEPKRIWACYDNGGWEGSATIVFERGDQWYLVEGSHCSCYGLEGQWKPEKFDPREHLKAVKDGKRIAGAYLYAKDDLDKWLAEQIGEANVA